MRTKQQSKKRSISSSSSSPQNKRSKPTVEYEYSKYVTTIDDLHATLGQFGVAIIPSVLDEKECTNMMDGLWNFFEYISQTWNNPMNRNDPETWREFYNLMPNHSMLVQHFGIGQSQVCWDIRQNPKIVELFAHFWNCNKEDLLVSFDAASFGPPPETTNKGWNRNRTWYHTDQSYTYNDFRTVQSWVTAQDVEDGDATLAIMESSHLYHQDFAEEFKITNKADWFKLDREQESWYFDHGCTYKKIKCPKGSLVFWDSRTIHCGVEANKGRLNPKFRAVVYLCYMPKNTSSEKELEKKRNAFKTLRTTSHYANKAKLFAKEPQHYGKGLPEITAIQSPILSDLGRSLAGFSL